MTDKDDLNNPDDPSEGGNGGNGGPEDGHGMPAGLPPGTQKRKLKVVYSQGSQDVKFADLFGFTMTPAHGLVKFGVLHPETGEFVVHTQIAMTQQGMMALSNALQKNIQKISQMKGKKRPGMN